MPNVYNNEEFLYESTLTKIIKYSLKLNEIKNL